MTLTDSSVPFPQGGQEIDDESSLTQITETPAVQVNLYCCIVTIYLFIYDLLSSAFPLCPGYLFVGHGDINTCRQCTKPRYFTLLMLLPYLDLYLYIYSKLPC